MFLAASDTEIYHSLLIFGEQGHTGPISNINGLTGSRTGSISTIKSLQTIFRRH